MGKILNFEKRKKLWILVVLVLSLFGLILKILIIAKHSTAFTYDQGRDLLDLREMWLLRRPRLIGANTSLHGVFYGPFWYWIIFPFYVLTGGHPLSSLIPLLIFSFLLPILVFLIVSDKLLGIILGLIYIFSYSFLSHSIIALNTNPIVFITPLIILFLGKFCLQEREIFLLLVLFLVAASFHFEPVFAIFLIPLFLATLLFFKKTRVFWRMKKTVLFFILPFIPQLIFELRHNFLQIKTIVNLITGKGSSLTPASGNLSLRLVERLEVFKHIWFFQGGNSLFFATILFFIVIFFIIKILFLKKHTYKEVDVLFLIAIFSLVITFLGFVCYPYALWPWYLGGVDVLYFTLIGLGIYSLFIQKKKIFFILGLGVLIFFIFYNIARYFPFPLKKEFSSDPANLRTRIEVIDSIYKDAAGKGINVFTFAPYVYDYPYQYLIWWRAKTKHHYLPEKYYYLANQPEYVPAKGIADKLIPSKKAECDYLIIEPFESQEEWFLRWRGNFPEAKKIWQIGQTKIEKLCAD